jgi:hypothetical protein
MKQQHLKVVTSTAPYVTIANALHAVQLAKTIFIALYKSSQTA